MFSINVHVLTVFRIINQVKSYRPFANQPHIPMESESTLIGLKGKTSQ